jgi:Cft2 family RNA processing exonuclease
MAYKKPRVFVDKGETIEFTFYSAGHVAGAAGISIKYKNEKCFISGDVLFKDQRTIPGAQFPDEKHDVLVLETTRGNTERQPGKTRETEITRLLDMIAETLDNGGSCLIPAFALGRMQEIIAILHQAYREDRLPKVPIFCSGLGMALVEYFDHIARRTGLIRFRESMVHDLGIRTIKEPLTPGKAPKKQAIYILSSGMLVENTPSYTAAAALAGDHRNTFCFVGYCDPATAGGELMATPPGESFVFKALDYATPLKARVERFDLSGHADREELVDFAKKMNPGTIVLTHGEPEARDWFLKHFAETAPQTHVIDPIPGERFSL